MLQIRTHTAGVDPLGVPLRARHLPTTRSQETSESVSIDGESRMNLTRELE